MLTSNDIRSAFLRFFAERGHSVQPSASLVPHGDPTLLFTNAGMVQFKDVFLGNEKRPYARATTAQKCVRAGGKHNDFDNVGRTRRHHTFFEMMGNFSFGDYFKREAIGFAWEFLTGVMALDPRDLWVTVFEQDDEAEDLWREVAGVAPERIVRKGEKDNFWSMGETGPCGPCSEIIIDQGPAVGCGRPQCDIHCDCDRYLELWNLVFMQFNRGEDGTLTPLPRPSVDTGLGLERMAAVKQGVESNFETDLLAPIVECAQQLVGTSPLAPEESLFSYRVIADHSRAIAFLIADGVLPANEGRGYVLRRIIRRAIRHGRRLGLTEPFLARTCSVVIAQMGDPYKELQEKASFIRRVATAEEERFDRTIAEGIARLDTLVERLRAEGVGVVPGEEAFRLYDTYGLPLDLTAEVANERGMTVDHDGFDRAMERQREASQRAQQFQQQEVEAGYRAVASLRTRFVGYDSLQAASPIIGLVLGVDLVDRLEEGQEGLVVLETTPFYAAAGGQVADTGRIVTESGTFLVEDTQRPFPEVIVHRGRVAEGLLTIQQTGQAEVDTARRLAIMRNHTATHLLHRALRDVLGSHAQQAGSLVAPDRLRFDFTHLAPLSADELHRVEDIVNEQVLADLPVSVQVLERRAAEEQGAMALFGEKYGEQVRVVTVESFSKELCGGTHLRRTGQVGLFSVLSESSVGSGLRRIEAVTGMESACRMRRLAETVQDVARRLQTPAEQVGERVEALLVEEAALRKEVGGLHAQRARQEMSSLLQRVQDVNGVPVLAAEVAAPSADMLREMGDWLKEQLGEGVIVLGAVINDRPSIVAMVSPALTKQGLHAGHLVKEVASVVGGGGGGRPEMAQAGGRDKTKLAQALGKTPDLVAAMKKQ